jgi:hypothetical protein
LVGGRSRSGQGLTDLTFRGVRERLELRGSGGAGGGAPTIGFWVGGGRDMMKGYLPQPWLYKMETAALDQPSDCPMGRSDHAGPGPTLHRT